MQLRIPLPSLVVSFCALFVATTGSAFAASHLLTGKDIKNGSLTGADIKRGSLTSKEIKPGAISLNRLSANTRRDIAAGGDRGAQGPQGSAGLTGAQGPAGAKGEQGDAAPPGVQGTTGSQGLRGATGDSFDPGHVTPQTAQLFGFLPWRDTDATSTIGFSANAMTIATEAGGAGVDLPIAADTPLNRLGTIDYATGPGETTRLSLGIEIFGHNSGDGGNGTYTTLVFIPATPGPVSAFDGGFALWRTTQAIGTLTPSGIGQYTWAEIQDGLGGIYDTATVIAVHLQIGSSAATTPSSNSVSELTLGYKNAADPVVYGFGTE